MSNGISSLVGSTIKYASIRPQELGDHQVVELETTNSKCVLIVDREPELIPKITQYTTLPQKENDHIIRLSRLLEGEPNTKLYEGSICDILTDDYCIEVEWPHHWSEAIGRVLYMAAITQREPMLILLTESRRADTPHILQCSVVCALHDICLRVEEVSRAT